jgi:hypothetical protein
LKIDAITKDYLSDNAIFSDVFNCYVYGGKQVIQPEQLEERDSTAITIPYGSDGAALPIQKYRDVQKIYKMSTNKRLEYILYSAESQAEIHYAAPVKNNLYDAIDYAGQAEEAAKSHRKAMKEKTAERKPNAGEFLSGFWKSDRLIPSITVMIYFGAEKWDGPLSLFEMMDVEDPEILQFMNDYKINLIAPAQMADEEIMKFQSSLREVLLFIKYSKDKENLNRIMQANEKRFREVERRAADVIKAVTNVDLQYEESEVEVDMCQAWQDMQMESRLKQAVEDAKNLYKLGVDVDKIAQGIGWDVETVKGWVIYSGESQSKELIYSIEQEIKEKSKIERETKFILNMYQKGYTLEEIADVAEKTVEEVKTILGK